MSLSIICTGSSSTKISRWWLTVLTLLIYSNLFAQAPMSSTEHNLPELYHQTPYDLLVIAHRGASAYYPENTMPSFRGAVELNADMIELDIQLSKDGVPVVFHDAELTDHTNGQGMIADYTLKELKKLDAGSWFDQGFAGTHIPTLEEVLEYAGGKIALNIEIKTEAVTDSVKGGVEEKCLQLVKKYGMEKHVLFSSFDYRAVAHLRELDSDIPVAILYDPSQSNKMMPHQLVKKYQADAFNCSHRQLSRKWVADLQKHDIPTFIYTVNGVRKMKKLIGVGVSGMFTNKPDLLLNLLTTTKQ